MTTAPRTTTSRGATVRCRHYLGGLVAAIIVLNATEFLAMELELDRNGIPIYTGAAEYFDEWKERAYDLYYSRAGNEGLQARLARHCLRSCAESSP